MVPPAFNTDGSTRSAVPVSRFYRGGTALPPGHYEGFDSFAWDGRLWECELVDTSTVTDGVTAFAYSLKGNPTTDLAVVVVEPGKKTPLQLVVAGDETWEGHLRGPATLTVGTPDQRGEPATYRWGGAETAHRESNHPGEFADTESDTDTESDQNVDRSREILVHRGNTMQWTALGPEALVFYEVCTPPFEAGRFIDLPDPAEARDV